MSSPSDVPWPTITLGLGAAIFAVALVKNLTDAGSSWPSYAFVGLAGAVLVGAYLDWADGRKSDSAGPGEQAPGAQVSRLTRSARSSPGPS